jgi:hypothetical protein
VADAPNATLAPDDEAEAPPAAELSATQRPWSAVLMLVGEETTDGRIFHPEGMTIRDLPLSLWYLPTNPHGGMFDQPGQLCGRIDTVELVGNQLRGTGIIDTTLEAGEAPIVALEANAMRWLSADNGASEYEVEERNCEGCDPMTGEGCEDCQYVLHFTVWEFMGATMLGIPAFPQAVITLDDQGTLDEAVAEGEEAGDELLAALGVNRRTPCCGGCADGHGCEGDAITASGAPGDVDLTAPPAEWFTDPHLSGPTPLTVTDDGRVFGHVAAWGTCHTGYPGECVLAPRSRTDYAYFRTGSRRVTNGPDTPASTVAVGQLTIGSGHAPLRANPRAAAEHYDNAATAWADVAAGEDAHGIWIAGAVRPGITDEQLVAARASALSGDWRNIGGNLEMLAALSVNSPGFPVVSLAAAGAVVPMERVRPGARVDTDGLVLALVAAGRVTPVDPIVELRAELRREVQALRLVVEPLRQLAAQHLVASLQGPVPA